MTEQTRTCGDCQFWSTSLFGPSLFGDPPICTLTGDEMTEDAPACDMHSERVKAREGEA